MEPHTARMIFRRQLKSQSGPQNMERDLHTTVSVRRLHRIGQHSYEPCRIRCWVWDTYSVRSDKQSEVRLSSHSGPGRWCGTSRTDIGDHWSVCLVETEKAQGRTCCRGRLISSASHQFTIRDRGNAVFFIAAEAESNQRIGDASRIAIDIGFLK